MSDNKTRHKFYPFYGSVSRQFPESYSVANKSSSTLTLVVHLASKEDMKCHRFDLFDQKGIDS